MPLRIIINPNVSRNRDVCLQKRYRYFVSDYDLKQYVKTFFKRPAAFFRAHSRFIVVRSQWRN